MKAPLVVRPRTPSRLRFALVAAVGLGLLMVWGVFEWGRRAGGHDAIEAGRARQALAEEILRLQSDNEELRREIALMKSAGRVDSEAYGRISEEIDDLQSQIVELNEELAFYRGIMDPSQGGNGLKVQTVQIERAESDGAYRIRLVLVQAGRQDRRVSGSLRMTLVGATDGGPRRLDVGELGGEDQDLQFAFRYFQILEREVALPARFRPERVDLHVEQAGRGREAIDVSFPWTLEEA